jgi:hypothetical protein
LASTPARRAPRDAVFAVLRAAFCDFCWRARAWPPFFAAALRVAVLREEEPLVERFVLEVDLDPDLLLPPLCAMRVPLLDPPNGRDYATNSAAMSR